MEPLTFAPEGSVMRGETLEPVTPILPAGKSTGNSAAQFGRRWPHVATTLR